MTTLADRVNAEMKRLDIGQEALAAACGVSQAAINKVATGKTKNPGFIVELAKALGRSPEYLRRGTLENEPAAPPFIYQRPDVGAEEAEMPGLDPIGEADRAEGLILDIIRRLSPSAKSELDVKQLAERMHKLKDQAAPPARDVKKNSKT